MGSEMCIRDRCDVAINQWDLLPTLHDYSESDEALPEDLDGGSLRPVFEYGNAAKVERNVEGFVYHYPCYFAPPLTVIRLGDYKLMEHHLTGEQKLFNVATDYYEQQNLVEDLPQKAAELKAVMDKYLEEIDAEDVQDVYQARFAELDRFEKNAREQYKKRIERAGEEKRLIDEANNWLREQLERFDRNRKECRENMQGKMF